MNRRDLIRGSTIGAAVAAVGTRALAATPASEPFRYCLNTSTLQGFKLPIAEELALAASVGYQGVEPWIHELEAHEAGGHSVVELGKKARDLGLAFPSVIGFFEWVVDDEARRRQGFESARKCMELVKKLGGTHIAAPPVGATDQAGLDLDRITKRYVKLIELGREIGVLPEVEVWGFSKTLGRLADASYVAIASGAADATILPDVYHMYKGGTPHRGLLMLNGKAIPAIHMNDYPSTPDRATIKDEHRVYPGDGVAPLGEILRDLRAIGFEGHLSLELFNREYWKQDPKTVAETGLQRMKSAVRAALG